MTRLDAGPAESRRAPLPRCLTLTMQIKCAQTSTAWKGGGAIPVVVVVVAMASTRRDFFERRGVGRGRGVSGNKGQKWQAGFWLTNMVFE